MNDGEMLTMLKLNLSMTSTAYDTYLTNLLDEAKRLIAEEGVTFEMEKDWNLAVMYAAYLFRKRAEDNPPMPRMLRYALNNRLFSEKMRVENGT